MKKISIHVGITLMTILFVATMLILFIPSNTFAEAFCYDEADLVFMETVQDVLAENYEESCLDIVSNKDLVYDINLKELGLIYRFTIEGQDGYVIIINRFGYFEAVEIFFDAISPYNLDDAYRIFVCPLTYITYSNGDYMYCESREIIDEESLEDLRQKAYGANDFTFTYSTDSISFVARNESGYELAKRLPSNTEVPNLKNDCVPVAGANIIQFWDRYATDLIPNFTPGAGTNSSYLYKESNLKMEEVITTLYNDMKTSSTGTTIDKFKNGMTAYTKRHGYNITFTSVMDGSRFNYDIAKQIFLLDHPMVLFVDCCAAVNIDSFPNVDNLDIMHINGAHAMAAFGYKEIQYNLTNGSRTDYYLRVATGITQRPKGYLSVNNVDSIDDAYGVVIK